MKKIQKQEIKDAYVRWKSGAELRKWSVEAIAGDAYRFLVRHETGAQAVYNTKTKQVESYVLRRETIDFEPTWEAIVTKMIYPENLDVMRSELVKLARIGDLVRQAQKKGKVLTLYPDGSYKEVNA